MGTIVKGLGLGLNECTNVMIGVFVATLSDLINLLSNSNRGLLRSGGCGDHGRRAPLCGHHSSHRSHSGHLCPNEDESEEDSNEAAESLVSSSHSGAHHRKAEQSQKVSSTGCRR